MTVAVVLISLLLIGQVSLVLAEEDERPTLRQLTHNKEGPAAHEDEHVMAMAPSPSSVMCVRDSEVTTLFKQLSKGSSWDYVGKIETNFTTYHTQGLYKIDNNFFVSAVEIIERSTRTGFSTDALFDFSCDRTTGIGKAWLFKFDATSGELKGSVDLSDCDIYHPGGIDFDGKHIWVPVAEYRPNSHSNIFIVDPDTLEFEKVFEYPDHIGGIVHNTNTNTLHGVSWGSRRLYEFDVEFRWDGSIESVEQTKGWVPNPQKYIDYQDCHYQGVDYMICGGLNKFNTPIGQISFGGLDLVDLRSNVPAHSVPVQAYIDEFGTGESATLSASNNAYFIEVLDHETMRMYFQTETKDEADVVIYDVKRFPTEYPGCM